MKNFLKNKNESGFSLIELLVYISLIGIITIIFTNFTATIVRKSIKASTINEVNQSARFLLSRISQEIKIADNINIASAEEIVLTNAENNSITISFDSINSLINYNGSPISNETIRVTSLVFTEIPLEYPASAVKIQLSVEQKNPFLKNNLSHKLDLSTVIVPRSKLY